MDIMKRLAVEGGHPASYWLEACDAMHAQGIESFREELKRVLAGTDAQALETARNASVRLTSVASSLGVQQQAVQEAFEQIRDAYQQVLDELCAEADAPTKTTGKSYAKAHASAHARAEAVREPLREIVGQQQAREKAMHETPDAAIDAPADDDLTFMGVPGEEEDPLFDPAELGIDTTPRPITGKSRRPDTPAKGNGNQADRPASKPVRAVTPPRKR